MVFEHQGKARRKEDVAVLGAFEGKIWGPRASPGPTRRGAGENQLRFQVRLDQAGDFCAKHRPAVRLERAKAVEVQDRGLMPSHGLLGVVGQINPIERHGDPATYVRSRRWKVGTG